MRSPNMPHTVRSAYAIGADVGGTKIGAGVAGQDDSWTCRSAASSVIGLNRPAGHETRRGR